MSQDIPSPLDKLQNIVGKTWAHIDDSRRKTEAKRRLLKDVLLNGDVKYSPSDTNIVVFGSLARGEVTSQSDLDWTLLIDGQANSDHLITAQAIENLIDTNKSKIGLKPPGRTGLFGSMTFSHDLIHRVGGEHDTNKNMTQRILLLLESFAVGGNDADAHSRVLTGILNRYLEEEAPFFLTHDEKRHRVPRFLLNDIVRFWRTIAVDFASKQRDRGGEGFGLRNTKLRMSRKLLFVSGLLMCFSSHLNTPVESPPTKQIEPILNFLKKLVRFTPLEVVAQVLIEFDLAKEIGIQLFNSYDEFLAILEDDYARTELDNLRVENSRNSELFSRVREIGSNFQQALDNLFFEKQPFRDLTRHYGIF